MCSIRVKQGLKSFIAFSGSNRYRKYSFLQIWLMGGKNPHTALKNFFFIWIWVWICILVLDQSLIKCVPSTAYVDKFSHLIKNGFER